MAFSTPLALSSLIAFIPVVPMTGAVVVRTHLEDKTLHKELDGHVAYRETVKYRLIPEVW